MEAKAKGIQGPVGPRGPAGDIAAAVAQATVKSNAAVESAEQRVQAKAEAAYAKIVEEFKELKRYLDDRIECSILLRQGFVVYRTVAVHGIVDLIGIKRGQVVRIQVKSEVGRHGLRRNDVLAVVTHDGLLRYRVRNRKIARLFEESRIIRQVNPPRKKRSAGKVS